MATIGDLRTRLYEAESALHQLMIGRRAVQVTAAGGGSITYHMGQIEQLDAYIRRLKAEIAALSGSPPIRRAIAVRL